MRKLGLMAAAVLAAVGVTAADAATYAFSFSGGGSTGSGTFTTADVPTPSGYYPDPGYEVTSISGTFDGVAIDGLLPVGTLFGVDPTAMPANPGSPTDNLFFPTVSVKFDYLGIGFSAGAEHVNIYSLTNPDQISVYHEPATGYDPSDPSTSGYAGVTFTGTAVPETATWAMMVGGLGMMGATLRGRRRVAAAA